MKNITINVPKHLKDLTNLLKEKGYEVVHNATFATDVDVNIITGVSSEYEEIESAQCRLDGDKEVLLINATNLPNDRVLYYIETRHCNQ